MKNDLSSSILTSTGKWFDILKPDPSLIDVQDIAGALSKLCRFGGHSKQFYSVAEHSILAAELMSQRYGNNQVLMRWALLHDASEAYVVDIPRPAKRQLAEYMSIENVIQNAIAERFGLPWPMPQEVHDVDNDMLSLELRAYLPCQPEEQYPPLPLICLGRELPTLPFAPRAAELAFLAKINELSIF